MALVVAAVGEFRISRFAWVASTALVAPANCPRSKKLVSCTLRNHRHHDKRRRQGPPPQSSSTTEQLYFYTTIKINIIIPGQTYTHFIYNLFPNRYWAAGIYLSARQPIYSMSPISIPCSIIIIVLHSMHYLWDLNI